MIALLRRLFSRRERHYIDPRGVGKPRACVCGYHSFWDYDLRRHFEETGRIGK